MNYEDYLQHRARQLGLNIDFSYDSEESCLDEEDDIASSDDWHYFHDDIEDIDIDDSYIEVSESMNTTNTSGRGLTLTVRKDKKFFINKDNKI